MPLPEIAHEADEAGADRLRDELGDEAVAAEEVVGVGGVEGGQALVGADRPRLEGAVSIVAFDVQERQVADVLEVGEVVDERVLGGAKLVPLGRGPSGRQAESAGGCGPGPSAGDAMDGSGDAVGFGDDLPEWRVVRRAPGIQACDRADGRPVEGADGSPPLLGRKRGGERLEWWRGLEPVDDEEQVRPTRQLDGEGRGGPRELGTPGVEVVDDREQRAICRRGRDSLQGMAAPTLDVTNHCAGRMCLRCELRCQPRLADPRLARDDDGAAAAMTGTPPVPAKPAQLGVAPDDRDDGVELGRQRRRQGRGGCDGGRCPRSGGGRWAGDAGGALVGCAHADDRDAVVDPLERRPLRRPKREPADLAGEVHEAFGREDLARACRRAQPSGLVERRAPEAVAEGDGFAGVEADPDAEGEQRVTVGLRRERRLELDRRPQRPTGRLERGERLVPAELDELAAPRFDPLGDDLGEPACQSGGRVVAMQRREARVAADVRDEERSHRGCPRTSLVDSGHATPPWPPAGPPHERIRADVGDTLAGMSRGAAQ